MRTTEPAPRPGIIGGRAKISDVPLVARAAAGRAEEEEEEETAMV